MADYDDNGNDRGTTEPTFDEPADPRKGGLKGDLFYAHQTRSGITTTISDVPGYEHWMVQHRVGQMIALLPNGGIHMRAHEGMHTFVMGQNRTYVTGADDKTTDGDSSSKTNGNYNSTVNGNSTQVTKGNSVVHSKNKAEVVAEQSDSVVGSATVKAKIGYNVQVTHGTLAQSGAKGVQLASKEESVAITGKKSVTLEGGQSIALTSATDLHIKVGGMEIYIDGSGVYINSNKAKPAEGVYKSTSSDAATMEGDFGAEVAATS
jgi:hypothetical protein